MPIRFVDRRAHLGNITTQLGGASSLLQGQHTQPPGRTGVITTQLGGAQPLIVGGFTPSANRTGSIITTLAGSQAVITGTHAGPGAGGFTFDSGFSFVSGAFGNNQVVRIRRGAGGFGSKPGDGLPIAWYPFDSNLNLDTTNSRVTTPRSIRSDCTFQTTLKPANAVGAAMQALDFGDASIFNDSPPFTFASTSKCFMRVERLHNHTNNQTNSTTVKGFDAATGLNLKTARIWKLGGSAGGGQSGYIAVGSPLYVAYFEPPADSQSQNPSAAWCEMAFGANGCSPGTNWLTCEHYYRDSSAAGASDGKWAHVRNGIWGIPLSTNWVTRTGSVRGQSIYIDEQSWIGSVGGIGYHGLYFDDSWAHGFISTESTYSTTSNVASPQHHRSICIPRFWSDTDVEVLLRLGQHASLTGKYLWLMNDAGTTFRVGQFT